MTTGTLSKRDRKLIERAQTDPQAYAEYEAEQRAINARALGVAEPLAFAEGYVEPLAFAEVEQELVDSIQRDALHFREQGLSAAEALAQAGDLHADRYDLLETEKVRAQMRAVGLRPPDPSEPRRFASPDDPWSGSGRSDGPDPWTTYGRSRGPDAYKSGSKPSGIAAGRQAQDNQGRLDSAKLAELRLDPSIDELTATARAFDKDRALHHACCRYR
jgi:hypothetical protein